jgi:hypothetical protein
MRNLSASRRLCPNAHSRAIPFTITKLNASKLAGRGPVPALRLIVYFELEELLEFGGDRVYLPDERAYLP